MRILITGPDGHAERVDGGDARTNGRLYVDTEGLVHWRAYEDSPSLREGEWTATHTGPTWRTDHVITSMGLTLCGRKQTDEQADEVRLCEDCARLHASGRQSAN